MKQFNRVVLTTLLALGAVPSMAALPTGASGLVCQAPPSDVRVFDLGAPVVGYAPLETTRPTVVEFFWYGCSHCATLQPSMKEWLAKDKSFKVVRIPAIASRAPGSTWETGAQVYYALLESGAFSEALHSKLFDAIHKDKKKLLSEKDTLRVFLSEQGLSFAAVSKTMTALEGAAVKDKVEQAKKATVAYKLSGTPALVLDNRYQVSPIESNGAAYMVPNMKKLVAWSKAQPSHCQSKR